MINKFKLDELIIQSFKEDITHIDMTSDILLSDDHQSCARMTVKEDSVVAGIEVAHRVFELMDSSLSIKKFVNDGDLVTSGTDIMEIQGKSKSILKAERLALNFIQRMSGIATMSRTYANRVKNYKTRIVDTRKTTPMLRSIEKYSVKVGGCYNHRYNLSDAVMIKDNHIKAAGGIKEAVGIIKANIPHTTKIEVEVQSIEDLKEAIDAGADIVMLDNMSDEKMAEAVKVSDGKVILEASGGITKDRLVNVAKTGVDVISVGALTHSNPSQDISLNFI